MAALRKAKPKLKWEAQHAEHKIKYKVSWYCCACLCSRCLLCRSRYWLGLC